jgi:soluble lytic murein transglycosylase-like protein
MKAAGITLHLARVYSFTKAGLALFGLVAVCLLMLLPVEREWLLASLPGSGAELMISEASAIASAPLQPGLAESTPEREQQALAEFIARRYRIADSAATSFVAIAYRAGKQHSVDPVLILSVMAIESRYNPVAESTVGAKGLMQVIPKFHLEKLLDHGGEEALLNPEVNIHVGAQILREYYRRFGDQEMALQMYAGAFDEPTMQYSNKVYAERARLEPIRQKARKLQTAQSV